MIYLYIDNKLVLFNHRLNTYFSEQLNIFNVFLNQLFLLYYNLVIQQIHFKIETTEYLHIETNYLKYLQKLYIKIITHYSKLIIYEITTVLNYHCLQIASV